MEAITVIFSLIILITFFVMAYNIGSMVTFLKTIALQNKEIIKLNSELSRTISS